MTALLLALLALQDPTAAGSAEQAHAVYERAVTLANGGDPAQAIGLLERAAAIDAALGEGRRQDLARVWTALGLCLSAVGRTEEAIARLAAAVDLWRALDDPARVVGTLHQLGVVEFSHSRLAEAQGHLEEALSLARARALGALVPGLLSDLGMLFHAMGQDARAMEHYDLALLLFEKDQDAAQAAATLGNIANLHLTAGRLSEAEAVYRRAWDVFDKAGDAGGVTATAVNLGMVYLSQGKYEAARAALEDGAERGRREGLPMMRASALLQLGHVLRATGLFDQAEPAYTESLELFRAGDNPQNVAAALSSLGSLNLHWGRTDRALALAQEALAIAERQSLPDQVLGSLELMGDAHRLDGRVNTSILHYRRALEVASRLGRDGEKGRIASALGTAFFCWKRYAQAEQQFREALAAAERSGAQHAVAQAWIHLGAVRQVEGDTKAARESYLRGLELARSAGATPDESTALNDLGTLALVLGDRREAERRFLEAIALGERFRATAKADDRVSSLLPWLSPYRWLIEVYFRDGNPSAVFDAAERIKARHLAERIGARTPEGGPASLGIDAFRRELAGSVAIVSFANVDWQNPVAVVATRDAIQAYAVTIPLRAAPAERRPTGDDSIDAPMLRGGMPPSCGLAALVAEYRSLLGRARPSPAQQARRTALARALFKGLLGPAQAALARADEIVVIPDGSLGLIPFETLRLPDGRFLVERYHVTYQPSLRVMQLLRQRGRTAHSRSLFAMGGAPYGTAAGAGTPAPPEVSARQWQALRAAARRRLEGGQGIADVYAALGRGGWSDLPGARAEVEEIGRLVPHSMVLAGAEVSEARLKALSRAGTLREFATLHFATHGITIAAAPELSALVLAEAGRRSAPGPATAADEAREDGYLSVEEIQALDMRPDFVNLSACDTGIGRIYGGEGAVGLTQAFLEVGAKGVSVSLWQVQDAFTRDFMVGLYRRLGEGGASPARALTEMKRALIREGKTGPFFWAPFVYYGSE